MDVGKKFNGVSSSDMGVLYPLLPFGLSSPVPKRLYSSHHAGLTFRLIKKFVSCTSIIKRRNALTENPARLPQLKIKDFKLGTPMRRNDAIDTSRNNRWTFGSALAHYARVYLMLRQRSALTFRAAAFKRRQAACERLAEQRVVPSSNEKVVNQARSERVNVGIRVLYSVLERV